MKVPLTPNYKIKNKVMNFKIEKIYLFIPLFIIGFMLTSCERDFIVEDEVHGLKIENTIDNQIKDLKAQGINYNFKASNCDDTPCGFTMPDTSNPPNGNDFNVCCKCFDYNQNFHDKLQFFCDLGWDFACELLPEACCNLIITQNNCLIGEEGWEPITSEDCASCYEKPNGGDGELPDDQISGGK